MRMLYRNKVAYALHDIFHFPIMYLHAPIGYGKTTMVLDFIHYLKEIDDVYFSIHMESDDQWTWYKSVEKLQEYVKLPLWMQQFQDDEEFIQICISELTTRIQKKTVLILDDCEWMKRQNFMNVWIKIASANISNFHLLLISRDQPSLLLHELETKGLCKFHGNDLFLFDQEEVSQLARVNGIQLDDNTAQQIYKRSNGWPSAVRALIQRYQDYGDIQNNDITKMLEHTIFWKLDIRLRITLMKLSVLKDFTLAQASFITKDKKSCHEIYQLANESFFMRVQAEKEDIRIVISPIFKEILRNQIVHSEIDFNQIYERAGKWEEEHCHYQMAFYYYDRANSFLRIVTLLETVKEENCVDIAPSMMYMIYDHIPKKILVKHPYAWLRIIFETCTDLSYTKGIQKLSEFEDLLQQHQFFEEQHLRGEVNLIKGVLNFNDIRRMGDYFYQAYEAIYPRMSKVTNSKLIINFESPHTLYLYHITPGDLHDLVLYISEQVVYFSAIASHLNSGLEDSAKAEEALETGNIRLAQKYAWKGIYAAARYEINYMVATCYFTLCRCAIQLREYKELEIYVNVLKRMKEDCKSPYLNNEIDCILYYVYCKRDQMDLIPEWLRTGEIQRSRLLDQNMYQYIIYGQILIKEQKFKELQSVTYHMEGVYEKPYHVFGMIYTYLYRLIACSQLQEPYMKIYEQLKALCEPDHIIMPILEEPIACAVINQMPIDTWNTAFQKYKIVHSNQLQDEILYLLSQGYKRKEIAVILNKKIDSINYHMKQLFKEYNVGTKEDLIEKYRKKCV